MVILNYLENKGIGDLLKQGKFKNIGLINDEKLYIPKNEKGLYGSARKKILVYFIGGVTYAEIAAVRLL